MSAFRLIRRFRDLLDVNWGTFADDDVPQYDAGTGKFVGVPMSGGVGSQTVILAPDTDARNVIQPTAADVLALGLKGAAAQTEDLLQAKDSTDAILARLNALGFLGVGIAPAMPIDVYRAVTGEGTAPATSQTLAGIRSVVDLTSPNSATPGNTAFLNEFTGRAVNRLNAAGLDHLYALYVKGEINAPSVVGGDNVSMNGLRVDALSDALNTWPIEFLQGIEGNVFHNSAQTITSAYGLQFGTYLTGISGSTAEALLGYGGASGVAGTFALWRGLWVVPPYAGPGVVITNYYGIDVYDDGSNYWDGSFTNYYGIRLRNPTQTVTGTKYGIVVDAGKNIFTDGLLIGLAGAPADAYFANSQGGWYAAAADALPKWKGKTSGGVVVNFTPQAQDADLDTIAGLTPSNDDFLQRKAGAWVNRTIAQVKSDLSLSGTNTGDQTSVTGNAGTATALQNARTIDGQSFDGTANITVIAPGTHAATGKTTPVDADELPLVDSAAANVLKKLTWANLKATLKTYFDTLYSATGAYAPGGTDVAVADGGTGASSAATARTNLGVAIGTNVAAAGAHDFNGQAGVLVPTARGWTPAGSGFTNNRVVLSRFVLSKDFTASGLKFRMTTGGTGNVDVGIYDATLANKLASSGSTASKKGANQTASVTFTSTVALTAGTVYYAALESDTADGTHSAANFGSSIHDQFFGTAAPNAESLFKDTTYPLPSSISTPTASSAIGPIFALI